MELVEKLKWAASKGYLITIGPIYGCSYFSVRVTKENRNKVYQFKSLDEVNDDSIIQAIDIMIHDFDLFTSILESLENNEGDQYKDAYEKRK